jgi:nitrogenase molybdenum-iron protein alpha/beta subunit
VRQLGEAFGKQNRAEAFIDSELSRAVPRLEWVIPFMFQNRGIGYIGDPHLLPGMISYIEMLGGSLRFAIITNRPDHTRDLPGEAENLDLLIYPRSKTFSSFLASRIGEGKVDALVASDTGHFGGSVPTLEIGFPSPSRHALYERPFLGFGGALAFADSLADRMQMHAVYRSRDRRSARVPE